MIKKYTLFLAVLGSFLMPTFYVYAQVTTQGGGTGSTSPSGILFGDGTLHLKTVNIGSNLTFTGGTLSASGGGGSSSFGTSSLSALLPLVYTQSSSLAQFSTLFSTTTDTGLGHNLSIYTSNSGVLLGVATSSTSFSIGGNAGTATKLVTARTLSITGDLSYTSPSFDGSGNVTAAGTLATVNTNVGTFTYPSVTVNGKGLITAISNGTAPTTYTGTYPIQVTGSVISTAFGTTSTWGIANDGFVYTSHTGIPLVVASSSLDLPNTALQNSTISGVALGSNLNTLTISSPLTGSSYNGSAGVSIGCQTASGSQAGCLSSADWTTFNNKGSGTVTSIATNNGLTGGTITTSGTIGLATINAGVLGAVTNGSVPTSQATSTLYGTGTGGQLLTWNNGVPQWVASTTYANGTGISTAFATGQLTITNTGVISLGNGTGINCSGTNPGTCSIAAPVSVANGGTNDTSLTGDQILYTNHAGTQVVSAASSTLFGVTTAGFVWAYENGAWGAFATSTGGGSNYFTNSSVSTYLSTGVNLGIGTTTPFGQFAISLQNAAVPPGNLAFDVASSTLSATTTLFKIDNIGQQTIQTVNGTSTWLDSFGTTLMSLFTGSTTGSIFTVAATTSSPANTIKLFDVDQYGHLTASSTGPAQPTISACGSGSPTMSATANDDTGSFTTGTSASACTVTFARAYAVTPTVVISDSNTTAVADISAVSTTAFTVSLASALSAVTVYYIVVQP